MLRQSVAHGGGVWPAEIFSEIMRAKNDWLRGRQASHDAL
jgi:hypothetical protein